MPKQSKNRPVKRVNTGRRNTSSKKASTSESDAARLQRCFKTSLAGRKRTEPTVLALFVDKKKFNKQMAISYPPPIILCFPVETGNFNAHYDCGECKNILDFSGYHIQFRLKRVWKNDKGRWRAEYTEE